MPTIATYNVRTHETTLRNSSPLIKYILQHETPELYQHIQNITTTPNHITITLKNPPANTKRLLQRLIEKDLSNYVEQHANGDYTYNQNVLRLNNLQITQHDQ